jgi:hypothetical protein
MGDSTEEERRGGGRGVALVGVGLDHYASVDSRFVVVLVPGFVVGVELGRDI